MCRYSEFHPFLFQQHSKLDPAPIECESFNKVGSVTMCIHIISAKEVMFSSALVCLFVS